ncbi:MAG: type 4a pilus biogenesis protein PilO [Patescibacteria group bacterium]
MNKRLITAILFAIEGVLFFAFGLPQYRELRGAWASREARETLLQDTKIAQRSVVDLGNQYTANESTIARVLLALPKQKQYDYLTESFQAAARDHGMELSSLGIGEAQKGKGDYQVIPLKAELSGNYPSFLAFLDTLERSLRLYDITKIDITEQEVSGGFSNRLTIMIQGNAYSLK